MRDGVDAATQQAQPMIFRSTPGSTENTAPLRLIYGVFLLRMARPANRPPLFSRRASRYREVMQSLLIVSNRQYAQDFRRHLMDAAAELGAASLHIRCDSNIIISDHTGERFNGAANDTAPASRLIQDIIGEAPGIVLTGMNGVRSDFGLGMRKTLPNHRFIYDVSDDFRYGAKLRGAIKWLRNDILWRRHCDGVVVLSESLQWRYPGSMHLNNASHVVANGAPLAARKDKLVMVGSIDTRLDIDLLEDMLQAGIAIDVYGRGHSTWTQAFDKLMSLAQRYPALLYQGPYNNDDLDSILGNYKIGLVPYKDSELTRHINPDKAYHYLNAGLEVICSGIKPDRAIAAYVHVVQQGDWAQALEAARGQGLARHWPAADFSWRRRWEELRDYAARL